MAQRPRPSLSDGPESLSSGNGRRTAAKRAPTEAFLPPREAFTLLKPAGALHSWGFFQVWHLTRQSGGFTHVPSRLFTCETLKPRFAACWETGGGSGLSTCVRWGRRTCARATLVHSVPRALCPCRVGGGDKRPQKHRRNLPNPSNGIWDAHACSDECALIFPSARRGVISQA